MDFLIAAAAYISDAFGLPELYHLSAVVFRRALSRLLDDRVQSGEWSAADAVRVAHMIGSGNAERAYSLPVEPSR